MANLTLECFYCPGETLLSSAPSPGQSVEAWRGAWKTAAAQTGSVSFQVGCPDCGCTFTLQDDGVPIEDDGIVSRLNISTPRVDSLSIGSGVRAGGEALYVFGSALDVGNLVVKFNGKPAQVVTNRTATQARVVTPVGRYCFTGAQSLHRLKLSNVTGGIATGNIVTFTNGSRATVRRVETTTMFWVQFAALTGTLAGLTGQVATGPSGSGPVSIVSVVQFIPGEGAVGLISGARGVICAPFGADAPTAAFISGEVIQGEASGACALLGSPAYSGCTDITVENEHGLRQSGGTLVGGFTYL